uniref:L antigen family member 3 n=1 Tax=Cynoglossus semilaevis TaxID=244447 RepID=A0A3P8UP78_CYNSE
MHHFISFFSSSGDGGDSSPATQTYGQSQCPVILILHVYGSRVKCLHSVKIVFLEVPFPTSREAEIALRSLSPDREPRKGGITKELVLSENILSVRWSADEARILRVSVNSFLDHLSLVVETMEMFGPPVSL